MGQKWHKLTSNSLTVIKSHTISSVRQVRSVQLSHSILLHQKNQNTQIIKESTSFCLTDLDPWMAKELNKQSKHWFFS